MTKSFEEFEVYQKGILLAKIVFKLLENKAFEREYSFKDQIKRVVISIAEGSEYNNNRQLIRYLKISKGSCAEVRSMLILSRELGFCSQTEIEESYKTSIEISQNLSNFIKYLSTKIKN